MSWMDSWSRPSKSQATPVPYYMLPGGDAVPYCHSCGRVVGARKEASKYCSSRCRSHKPRRLDREVEGVFAKLLRGQEVRYDHGSGGEDGEDQPLEKKGSREHAVRHQETTATTRKPKAGKKGQKAVKGDPRILVSCDEVERLVFGDHFDPSKTFGRRKNRASRVIQPGSAEEDDDDSGVGVIVDADADADGGAAIDERFGFVTRPEDAEPDADRLARLSVRSGTRVRPPQSASEVNGSVGGEKGWAERAEESEEMARRRSEGQRRAQEREMVRCAARRGVVFGFAVRDGDGDGNGDDEGQDQGETGSRRKCEAVMQGKVVEPSFAKGDWAIRWRE
ncbi:hypothetical protein F5Y15DRAFT_419091 [Xylariaceae sp. FL0016]|nr:hypothetical protein F5Y15DRAFT_419091 [Xylariaceae sp. FL0016]